MSAGYVLAFACILVSLPNVLQVMGNRNTLVLVSALCTACSSPWAPVQFTLFVCAGPYAAYGHHY